VEAVKVTARMRSRVRENETVRPSQVIATEMLTASSNVRAALGDNKDVLRRKLRRHKRRCQPPDPTSLATISLTPETETTGEEEGSGRS